MIRGNIFVLNTYFSVIINLREQCMFFPVIDIFFTGSWRNKSR